MTMDTQTRMHRQPRSRRKAALLIAALAAAMVAVFTGGAVAGSYVTSADIKNDTVRSADIKNGRGVGPADFKPRLRESFRALRSNVNALASIARDHEDRLGMMTLKMPDGTRLVCAVEDRRSAYDCREQ